MLTLTELLELKKKMIAEINLIHQQIVELDTAIMLERYALKFDKEQQPVTDKRALELMTEAAQC